MSPSDETPGGRRALGGPGGHDTFDRELDLRGILGFAALVVATTALLHLIVWGMMVGYRRAAVRRDPPPSPLAEANERRLPPAPRLQDAPSRDMASLRAEEDARLSTHGWVDRAAGVGRIPIERAIDLILTGGLPEVSAPSGGALGGPGGEPGPSTSPRPPANRRGRSR